MPHALLHRRFDLDVRRAAPKSDAEASARAIDVIASTSDEDSYAEVVLQDWDLSRYLKNPVVLWDHNASGGFLQVTSPEDSIPIGHAENVRIEHGQLHARLTFVDEKANPLAEKIYQSFLQGSLRAVSVGFMPGEVSVASRAALGLPPSDKADDDENPDDVLVMSANVLFEISATPLPANPHAVMQSMRMRSIAKAARVGGAPLSRDTFLRAYDRANASASPSSDLLERAAQTIGIPKGALAAMAERVIGGAGLSATPAPSAALSTRATPPLENKNMPLELIAKMLGCEATEEAVTKALEAASARTKALEAEVAALEAKSAPVLALGADLAPVVDRAIILDALGLDEKATDAAVTKHIVELTAKAARLDEVVPALEAATKSIADHDARESDREVSWLVACGDRKSYALGKMSRKALFAYRKADPTGFAEEYKAPLDGLKAYDPIAFDRAVSAEGGSASSTPANSLPFGDTGASDDTDARVAAYAAKHGVPRSFAIRAVADNADRQPSPVA